VCLKVVVILLIEAKEEKFMAGILLKVEYETKLAENVNISL